MEAYTDLHLTVAAFTEVLDEPEFLTLSAGIVLQAYLPDAYRHPAGAHHLGHGALRPRRCAYQNTHRQRC